MSSGTQLLETMQRDAATRLDSAFADDPNIAPYVDDIYGYLQPRADGALGRHRPVLNEDR